MRSKLTFVFLILSLAVGVLVGRFGLTRGDSGGEPSLRPLAEIDEIAYAVSQILIPVTEARPDGQARALARLAYRKLLDGADFAEVAQGRADSPNSQEGGFLGFVNPAGESKFSGIVQTLRPGQVSPPLQSQKAWQIVKRHTFEEGCALERKYFLPIHGFVVGFGSNADAQGRTREEALVEANHARAQVIAGEVGVGALAKRYNPQQRVAPDGFMRMTPRRPDTEDVWRALGDKEPGTVAEPIEMDQGWAVFMRGHHMRALVEHLIVQHVESRNRDLSIARTRAEAKAIAERALKEVLADPKSWDGVVAKYSDDKASRNSGGMLGLVGPGMMPEGFESVIYDLEPGKIADRVVESPFGYHLVRKVR